MWQFMLFALPPQIIIKPKKIKYNNCPKLVFHPKKFKKCKIY